MIQLLGLQRVVGLILSILVIAAVGGLWYYYLVPEMEQHEQEIRNYTAKITAKSGEIRLLKVEYDQLKDQIVRYNLLKERGFFNAQDRVTARETIRALASQVDLYQAGLRLSPATIVDTPKATEAKHKLLSGPMTIKLGSLDDVQTLKFVIALERVFPGYLEFEKLTLRRTRDFDNDMVKQIRERKSNANVDGEVSFKWWSMASEEQLKGSAFFNPTAVETPPTPPTGGP